MMKLKAKQILGLDSLNYIPKTGNTTTTPATSIYSTVISGGTLYGDGSNLTGIGAGSDTYVTGFTYSNNNLTIQQNLNKSPITVNISTMTGLTVNGSLSATTLYGDGSNLTGLITNDFYVTGGTFSGTTLTLERQNGTVTITGFSSNSVDTYTTGFTYSNNNFTISRNQNQSPLTVNVNNFTGLTVNGSLSATTYLGLPVDPNNYVTGGTFSNNTLTLTRQNGTVTVTGFTDYFVSGGTYSSGTLTLNRQNGPVTVTGFTDYFVTAGTFSNNTLTLTRQNGTVTVTGFTDIYTTGLTYSNNNITLSQTSGSSYNVNISVMTGLTVNGNITTTGNTSMRTFTGTSALISGSGQSILTVIGSGNSTTAPLFTVQGSSGELFSINDSLVGSLFSVNDISGLPILETFSDNTTLMGSYLAPSLNTTVKTTLTAGTNTVYSLPTSAYTGAFFDYTVVSTGFTGARAGTVMSIWSGTSAQYTDVATNDIGSTAGVSFSVAVSSNRAVLSSSATTSGWTLKTIVRGI